MTHAWSPVQAPVQPMNVEPPVGSAVRVTTSPRFKGALQVAPQSIPLGDETIVPSPGPLEPT
jgi:hypothetical protein